jgi:hypothetical protein
METPRDYHNLSYLLTLFCAHMCLVLFLAVTHYQLSSLMVMAERI